MHQTVAVKGDCLTKECGKGHVLEAILSNFERNNYMKIWFKTRGALDDFLKNVTSIEVNDERVSREMIYVSDKEIRIDVSQMTDRINYFFLKITSADDRFKESLRLIAMTK